MWPQYTKYTDSYGEYSDIVCDRNIHNTQTMVCALTGRLWPQYTQYTDDGERFDTLCDRSTHNTQTIVNTDRLSVKTGCESRNTQNKQFLLHSK